jgi:3-methyladenine DNA glycosylase Tag
MPSFKTIRARAAKRKGGEAALAALLPKPVSTKALARIPDDRILSDMAKRIFSAGFARTVIEKKWPGFEAAFLGFAPKRLAGKAGRAPRRGHRPVFPALHRQGCVRAVD